MPPKKTGAAKPAAGAKAGAKPKAGATKAGASKDPPKQEKKEEKPAEVKKIIQPEEVNLKAIAGLTTRGGDVGEKVKESKRWMYLIDRNGNVGTFLKYRDVNMIQATSPVEFDVEPLRKALMGGLRFGKMVILDISDTDQDKILAVAAEKYNAIYPTCWKDLMDGSIAVDEDKWAQLYKANDDDDYRNKYDYRVSDFHFAILTNVDPPSTAMENYYPIIIN